MEEPRSKPEYLSLDPGNSTGWATFTSEGKLITTGTTKGKQELYDLLRSMPRSVQAVICEDFKLYPWKSNQQAWSQLDTVRYIGAVELWCAVTNRTLILQPSSVKPVGYAWAGMRPTTRKSESHSMDAYVHGVYYLQSIGVRKPQQNNPERQVK